MTKHALPFLLGVLVGWLAVPWLMGMLSGMKAAKAA